MFYYDWTMILLIPGILIAAWAQAKVSNVYGRYSHIASAKGHTAAEVARDLLDRQGLSDVRIETVAGNLTDHYDPGKKVLRLSQGVYNSPSIAALGIAAHEVGHAYQHQGEYLPLKIRSLIVPAASFGSMGAWVFLLIGLFLGNYQLAQFGVLLFTAVVIFQLVTLPVELDVSSRAMVSLEGGGYLSGTELSGAKKVLDAAALTYVAALITAVLQMLRLLLIVGGMRRQD